MPKPRRQTKPSPTHTTLNPAPPKLLRLNACRERNLDWLWNLRVPLGKVTLLVGDPDAGKSFVALDLAARVSQGLGVPPETGLNRPGQVLLLCADDDVEDTIVPRLQAAEADLSRIAVLSTPAPRPAPTPAASSESGNSNANKRQRPRPAPRRATQALVSLARDMDAIENALDQLPHCRLIVIDPINAYLRGLGGNNDIAIRQLLQKLTRLARERDAAVLMTAHQRKQASPTALYRPLGSVVFAAVARVVLLLTHDPDVAGRRLLVPAKMTLHDTPTGRAFSIEDNRVNWEPEVVELCADDLRIIASDADDDPRKAAKDWLIKQIGERPLAATEIKRRAHAQRIPWRHLWAAKKACKATSFRDPKDQRYYWKMPDCWMPHPAHDLIPWI